MSNGQRRGRTTSRQDLERETDATDRSHQRGGPGEPPLLDLAHLTEGVRTWLRVNGRLAPADVEYDSLAAAVEAERPFHRALYDGGWSRWGWPVKFGGNGGDAVLRAAIYDEIYAAGVHLPPAFELLEIVGPTLGHFAPELAARYLPAALRGDAVFCQGFSEPDAGSDLASIRTRALADGDSYRIVGQKVWITHGYVAKYCLVLARTGSPESRHRGLGMFWVDLSLAGVTVRPIRCASGTDELSEIFLDDVVVPADHLVGAVDGGWEVAMYLLQFERGNYAWHRQAWLLQQLEAGLRRRSPATTASDREVGAAWLDILVLRARSRVTLRSLSAGEALGAATSVDKVLMSRAERAVFDTIRELRFPELEVGDRAEVRGRWFYSRMSSVYGGAVDVQRDLIVERVLGLPRS